MTTFLVILADPPEVYNVIVIVYSPLNGKVACVVSPLALLPLKSQVAIPFTEEVFAKSIILAFDAVGLAVKLS